MTGLLTLCLCFCFLSCQEAPPPADLILANGEIYTMEADQPWAGSVAVTGNEITAVLGEDQAIDAYVGDKTRVVDLEGKFVMPGYIDAHTHFDGFGAMQNDADLLAVSDDTGLIPELERLVAILPSGEWITGGKWDAHRLWNRRQVGCPSSVERRLERAGASQGEPLAPPPEDGRSHHSGAPVFLE
jgi:hypothetical protein